MAADFVEVCFPAWSTRRSLASPPIAFSDRVGLAPLGAAAFVAFAVAVPGTIALVSVVMLTFLLAFVLLAPFAMMLRVGVLATRPQLVGIRAAAPR